MEKLQVSIEKIGTKYLIMSRMFKGTTPVYPDNSNFYGVSDYYVYSETDTLTEAKILQKNAVTSHNTSEKVNPSYVSRVAIAV